ncbi:MAG: hypothetical protein LBT23_09660, partial [Synergistaceae bacterium]|nr:hypothetical protein [Synergistaceae bacterium]
MTISSPDVLARMLGTRDEILSQIEDRLGVKIVARGTDIHISDCDTTLGDDLANLLEQFAEMTTRGARPSG